MKDVRNGLGHPGNMSQIHKDLPNSKKTPKIQQDPHNPKIPPKIQKSGKLLSDIFFSHLSDPPKYNHFD